MRGSTAGWQIGFIQAQWIETNWAVYRGRKESAGSVFVQRARPPAQAYRDAASAGTPFYARPADGIFEGRTNDPRFLTIMTTPQPVTCNTMAQAASLNPNINEAAGWPSFHVRR